MRNQSFITEVNFNRRSESLCLLLKTNLVKRPMGQA
jgi:hypothetical protein